jgi:2-polyprenyl-3-methyl-5-hydroxy-6-metoxy-1,4-benzoquinol methylase
MATTSIVDSEKRQAFVGRVLNDASATFVTTLAALGDRLGLFKTLATGGPATSAELAARAGIHERYAREWLGGMTTAGYLTRSPDTGRFELPPEHAAALADEGGPFFSGGAYEMLLSLLTIIDPLTEAFRQGGGVPQARYDERFWEGMERFTAGWFDNQLLQEWLPAMPEVQARLECGTELADVGCGRGRALLRLAEAFPASHFVGFDVFAPNIEVAEKVARDTGLEDRIRFEARDVSHGLPRSFDVITTFDVVHDAVEPLGLLRSIREGLRSGGIYVCLETNCADTIEGNKGPLGSLFHGMSVLYCLTTSLSNSGAELGTLGLHEHRLREYAIVAGFRDVRRVFQYPFNNLYELR